MALTKHTEIIKPIFESIPEELKRLNQWLLWKVATVDGKLKKMPINSITGQYAKWKKEADKELLSFEEVKKHFSSGKYDGIQFLLTDNDPYLVVDLDDVHYMPEKEGHERFSGFAQLLIQQSYSEISPSGQGLHIWVKGRLPDGHRIKNNTAKNIELFDCGKLVTFTGRSVGEEMRNSNEIAGSKEIDNFIMVVLRKYFDFGKENKKPIPSPVAEAAKQSTVDDIDDTHLLNKMFTSENGSKIKALWDGNISDYDNDHSRADQALCNFLAFWTGKNPKRMDNLFRQSGLYRPKWDEIHYSNGDTIGERTIQKAISGTNNTYSISKRTEANNGFSDETEPKMEWEPPVSFDEYDLPPFPSNTFPEWLERYVEAVAESTQTPKDMASMAAVSVLSIAAAKKYEVNPYGSWVEPLNTYLVTLMGPANRKSSVFDLMIKPILQHEQEERERLKIEVRNRKTEIDALKRRLEAVKNMNAKKPDQKHMEEMKRINEEIEGLPELYLPSFIVDDVTPEKLAQILKENSGKVGILSAEGGIFEIIKGRYSKELNMDIFLKGHSGDYTRIDRKNGSTEIIDRPALTIGIFAQPDILQDLPNAFSGRGLMARFLYSLPKDFRGHRKVRPRHIPQAARNEYMKNAKQLLNLTVGDIQTLTFTNEADFILQSFQQEIEERLREGNDLAELAEWAGKIVGQLLRFTALLHIAEHIPGGAAIPQEIEASTVMKAFKTKEYFISHAKAAFGCMEMNQELEDIKYLLSVIDRKAKEQYEKTSDENIVLNYRDIQQWTKKRFKKSDLLKTSLSELENYGYIREGKKGRKVFYHINPYILENYRKHSPISPITGSTLDTKGFLTGEREIPPVPHLEKSPPFKSPINVSGGTNGEVGDKWEPVGERNKARHINVSDQVGEMGEQFQLNEKQSGGTVTPKNEMGELLEEKERESELF